MKPMQRLARLLGGLLFALALALHVLNNWRLG